MTAVEIRAARADDYATFLRLSRELGIDDPAPDAARWTQLIQPTMIVAARSGEPVGYTYHRLLDGIGHLAHLATAPSARRTGVGRALVTEVIRRVKEAGGAELYLNVRPQNAAAIALYSSFGLRPFARSWALRIPWAAVEAQPAPLLDRVRTPEPSEDEALDRLHGLPRGLLASRRRVPNAVARAIDPASIAMFDPGFPGVYPFLAESGAHAFSLLHALRPHARRSDGEVLLSLEDQPALKDALLAAGAILRVEILRMKGPI